jgi:hypothetical protein
MAARICLPRTMRAEPRGSWIEKVRELGVAQTEWRVVKRIDRKYKYIRMVDNLYYVKL